MKRITEEMKVHEDWYREAKNQTLETLPKFLQDLTEKYSHDYGTICHAITAGAIGTAWALDKTDQGGITGFQAGCIMWSFIKQWNYSHNKTGLKIVDYDNLLYPQYSDRFEKKINSEIWKTLQGEAKKLLKDTSMVAKPVEDHWESIVDGKVPFGFIVED